jgi:hypothetical protein
MLNVTNKPYMLNVVMLNVVVLSVIAPSKFIGLTCALSYKTFLGEINALYD